MKKEAEKEKVVRTEMDKKYDHLDDKVRGIKENLNKSFDRSRFESSFNETYNNYGLGGSESRFGSTYDGGEINRSSSYVKSSTGENFRKQISGSDGFKKPERA